MKKCEIFSRFWKNVLIYIVNVLIYIVNTKKCVDLHSKYEGKSIQIYANHHHHRKFRKYFTFFQFSQWFFYEFSKFLMFWKEEKLLSNLDCISIYEICVQVGVPRRFRFFSLLGLDLLTIQKLSWEIYWFMSPRCDIHGHGMTRERKLARTASSLLCPSAWCGSQERECYPTSIPQHRRRQASMKHWITTVYRYGDEVPVRQSKHVLKYDSRELSHTTTFCGIFLPIQNRVTTKRHPNRITWSCVTLPAEPQQIRSWQHSDKAAARPEGVFSDNRQMCVNSIQNGTAALALRATTT